jgi:autotransporter-associated beta strand protein
MCIGGWLDQSFLNIKNLIAANGTGTNTVLYQNLSALKNALSLNAMCYDDEYEYDSSSAVSFGQMCAAVGMKVTLCPYTNPSYWLAVKAGLGGTVDYVYLQCYAGGQGNDPATWSNYFTGSVPVLPGDWDADPGGDIGFLNLMHTGAKEGSVGGWFWPNEANGTVSINTLKHYINLIRAAFGPNIYWQGGTADYNAGANWAGGVVPGAGANAINDSGSNNIVQINAGDPVWTLNDLWSADGSNAKGAYVQNGSTVNVGTTGGWVRLGDSSGAVGYYTLNAGTLNATNNFDVGESGTGVLNINGGVINIGSAGLFDISDGGTKGSVTQTNGTINCSAQMWLGENHGTAAYTLGGGALNVHNYVAIGRNGGTGTFIMTGGTFTQDSSGNFLVGSDGGGGAAANGTVQQSAGTLHVSQQLLVPEANTGSVGTYNLSGAGILIVDNWLAIGRGGVGHFNMSGGSITKTSVNGGNLVIGAGGAQNGGAGTLTQTAGFITNTATATWLGEVGNATWNLNGGTDILGRVYMCLNNLGLTAALNLNGGLFQTSGITNNTPAGDTSTLSFNGGTLQANASNPNFVSGLSQALVKPGGAVIDSQTYSITIPQALLDSGGGGLTKLGTGTLTLAGANTYTGPTVISSGTLALTGSSQLNQSSLISVTAGTVLNVSGRSDQTLTLNSGQTLKGSGSVNGKLSALAGSTINPGDGIGALTVQNNITLAGQLLMELNRTNDRNCDQLASSAGTIAGGGVLTVSNLGPALQLGDTFQLFNHPVSGFTAINLPNVAPYGWANNLAADGTIKVAPASTISTNITAQATGNSLVLTWPSDHTGWQLQCQTNSLTGTNWVTLPGSTSTNRVSIEVDPSQGSLFFRLVYP